MVQNQGLQLPAMKVPVKVIIPVSTYPNLARLIQELDFTCPDCTREAGRRTWVSFQECFPTCEPLSGPVVPGRASVGPDGMIATRFRLFCPTCGSPMSTPWQGGEIDLLAYPKDYRKPARRSSETAGGLMLDTDLGSTPGKEAQPAIPVARKRANELTEKDRKDAAKLLKSKDVQKLIDEAVKENGGAAAPAVAQTRTARNKKARAQK